MQCVRIVLAPYISGHPRKAVRRVGIRWGLDQLFIKFSKMGCPLPAFCAGGWAYDAVGTIPSVHDDAGQKVQRIVAVIPLQPPRHVPNLRGTSCEDIEEMKD